MLKNNFYITKSGKIIKKDNTVYFENESTKKAIPVNAIDSLYCLGEVSINSKLLTFLAKQGILIHFFNYYGYYTGTFYPKETLVSGSLIINQVEHYTNKEKRMYLASSFVNATINNLITVLEHYRKHGKEVVETMSKLENLRLQINQNLNLQQLMNIEGRAWHTYYSSYPHIMKKLFQFDKRTKRPPQNEVNCLISFLNSLLYTTILSELYKTQLHPAISYLHEPFERRFSLALDLAEMFKPLLVQRSLLKLINKQEIQQKHFEKKLKGCLLNEEGRKIVLKEFDDRLKLTIMHPELKRLVSHRRLIRLEAYKLIKHLINDKKYDPFVIWW